MFNHLFDLLEHNLDKNDLLNEYDNLPEEIRKGYIKSDTELVKLLKQAIIKVNTIKNLTREEKLFINSINCELINFSQGQDFTLDDILDTKKSLEYNRRYYEVSLQKRFMPKSSKEFDRILNYNYQNIKLNDRNMTKEETDNFMACLLKSNRQYGQEYSYDKKIYTDCITSLTNYFLNKEEISDVKIIWSDIQEKNTWGQYGDNELEYNKNCIKGNIMTDYHMLETMFHEMTHAIQDKKNNDNFMEEIIHGKDMAIFQNSKGISKKINYHLVSYETDARIKGARKTLAYIKEIAPEVYLDFYKKIKNRLEKSTNDLNISERLLFNEVTDVHEAFDHCKKEYREWAVQNFTMLSLEYNDDGTKKDLGEMYEDYKRHQEYLKNAKSTSEIKRQMKFLNTYDMLFKVRKSNTIQTLKDIKSVRKLIDDKKIYHSDIKTSLDFIESLKRDTVFIKSRVTFLINPNKLNKMKIANTEKIGNIYEQYYDDKDTKTRTS